MKLWLIPSMYAVGSAAGGIILPRLESRYFHLQLDVSVGSASQFLSAVASGMMALTGIVFSIAFVLIQFNAIIYSPRLVIWFARDKVLFHAMGAFVATFMYSLFTLAWVDRAGSGSVPLVSCMLVGCMLVLSVMLLAQLVQRLNSLQITQVLQLIGETGRDVIRDTYRPVAWVGSQAGARADGRSRRPPGPADFTLRHVGKPQAVVLIDLAAAFDLACRTDSVIVMDCAVGDTLMEESSMLRCYGGKQPLSEEQLRGLFLLGEERTFEEDPKYALRLLVDIAIKALSPAINDPTTAVQAIDQIEDLLRRLAKCDLEARRAFDSDGVLRVAYQMPTWDDYLSLAFDEIRQYGSDSIQVMRRLRSALADLAESVRADRAQAVIAYLTHLDSSIEQSDLNTHDRAAAKVRDRQGLGISNRAAEGDELGAAS